MSKLPPEYLSSLLDPNSVDIVTPADLEAVVPLVDTALSFAAVLFSLQLVQVSFQNGFYPSVLQIIFHLSSPIARNWATGLLHGEMVSN